MIAIVEDYRASRELFYNLALRELRSKYKRSFLGWTWSLATPLATVVVYTIVFKVFFKMHIPPGKPSGLDVWALSLMCALLPWSYFQASVMGCISSLTSNASLIKKTYFPREILPASTVGANLVSHFIEMGLLLVALLAFGDWRALVFLPFALLLTGLLAIFALGLGLMLGAINVYFRDIEHFMSIVFLIWLYMTPIVYPLQIVPAKYQSLLKINPMTEMALCYRNVLYNGTYPGWRQLAYFAAWAVVALVAGLAVFSRLESGLAEEL